MVAHASHLVVTSTSFATAVRVVQWEVPMPTEQTLDERKVRILYVITKSNFGGAQRYLYDLATGASREGLDVTVAFGGTGAKGAQKGALAERLERASIRTIPLRHFMRDVSIREDIRAFVELLRLMRAERPDIVHVMSSKAGGLGAIAGRLAWVPIIVFTSHGLAYDESWRPWWQRHLIRIVTWCTMLCATTTIQISQDTYTRARALPGMKHKVVRIYNGIQPPRYVNRDTARTVLRGANANGSSKGELWIGTLAELHPNKNLDVLVGALASLHARNIRAHLWILGEGEDRARLERLARERRVFDYVHLPGYVQNAQRFIPAFDVFTLPSRKEGLPYVLIEAGYAALPVVVSDIPGNTDIVKHEISGLVVSATEEQFADALQTLIEDTDHAKVYGSNLRAYVRSHFNVERMIRETTQLYASSKPSIS
jgi:glycosyltransferase involved in cell wall biosynthesis